MSPYHPSRREFLAAMSAATAGASLPGFAQGDALPDYTGPNVIVVRFGGGVRRQETILDPSKTYCPYFLHELVPKGTLYSNMMIEQFTGSPPERLDTSHGQGTLYILSGRYEKYKDAKGEFLGARFESTVPTMFEYLRRKYNVPTHQTLIINGEDRTDEEFYTFSNHHLFGVEYRSNVLSLYRFKTFLLRRQLAEGVYEGNELEKKEKELSELEALDYRVHKDLRGQSPEIEQFWEEWREFYGDSGFVNPRGDRLLTELSVRAMRTLQPKLMMVNYNDPDYVHWGNPTHYTRGISVIDEGIRRLYETAQSEPAYRDNTIFVIVPDCGRDSNPAMEIPFQHHFNAKTCYEIFALVVGPGAAQGVVIDTPVQQVAIPATVGGFMGFDAEFAEAPALEEAFV